MVSFFVFSVFPLFCCLIVSTLNPTHLFIHLHVLFSWLFAVFLGSGYTQAISDAWLTIQEIFGCVDEDAELLSAVLCTLHQTK